MPAGCGGLGLQPPAPGSDGPTHHGQDYKDAVANQRNFELMLTFVNLHDASHECSSARSWQPSQQQLDDSPHHSRELFMPRRYAMAQFRCAATTGLDQHMLPIGIPNFLPSTAEGNKSFYFVTLREMIVQPSSANSTASSPAASQQQQQQQRRRPLKRMASFSLMASDEPFADIRLGPLLGKGAFGRVYRGMYPSTLIRSTPRTCMRTHPACFWGSGTVCLNRAVATRSLRD